LRRIHRHAFRHSAATALRAAYGVEASRVVLGHTEISTTEIYAERDASLAKRIVGETG
jgi:site-specific recombinase XerC